MGRERHNPLQARTAFLHGEFPIDRDRRKGILPPDFRPGIVYQGGSWIKTGMRAATGISGMSPLVP